MADTEDLKSSFERSAGSSPAPGTIGFLSLHLRFFLRCFLFVFILSCFCMSICMTFVVARVTVSAYVYVAAFASF